MLRTCCCGCSLAQGTIGTGVVSTIESVLYIVLGVLFLQVQYPDNVDKSKVPIGESFFHGVGIYLIVQGAVVIVACVFLFCAVKTKRRGLLLPWLIIRGILLGLSILGCVLIFTTGSNFIPAAANIFWLALMIYLYIVVVSYYKSNMETVSTHGQVLAPAPTTAFVPLPQQPQYEYKPPYDVASVPQTGVVTYAAPNPTGQQFYPTQTYAYTTQQPYASPQQQGTSMQLSQPPPYSTAPYPGEPPYKV